MIAAAEIKGGITIWAPIAARHVVRDAQLISAGAAENRRLVPPLLRPDLSRVVCQRLVAVLAGVIDSAAFHPDCDDVELCPVVSAQTRHVKATRGDMRKTRRTS